MASRSLTLRLSDADISGTALEEWQIKSMSRIQDYNNVAFQERMLLTSKVCGFKKASRDTILPWLSGTCQKVLQLSSGAAEEMANKALATHTGPTATNVDGIWPMSLFAWSFTEESLWRGPTDNKRLCRLARSMLNGYHSSEPIQSRTSDLSDKDGTGLLLNRLHFGDGQSRGLGAWLAWNVMMEWVNDKNFIPSPNLDRVFRSLLQVPAVFEARKQCLSNDAFLVDCAVKQNVKAQMQQPLNTLEWCHLILGLHGTSRKELLSLESPNLRKTRGQELQQIMLRFIHTYEQHSDVQAYDMTAPTTKRRRLGRQGVRPSGSLGDDSKEDTVKLGSKRQQAMKNVLGKISAEGFLRWQEHLGWVGIWKYNALQDPTAALDSMWPGSQLPKERRPSDLQQIACEVGQKVSDLAQGTNHVLTRANLFYNELLTNEQHIMMLHKGFETYEADTLHISNLNDKMAFRPSTEDWLNFRQVIEHWDRTIREVAMTDMDPKEFKEFEEAVLTSTVMDQQILGALEGYPRTFHLGMLPDLKATYQLELNDELEKMRVSNHRFWEASLDKFRMELDQDQQLIRRTKKGSAALADLLEWLELKSKIELQQKSQKMALDFAQHYFPILTAEQWGQVPGEVAVAMAKEVPISELSVPHDSVGRKLCIIKADFNTPNARDSMKLASLSASCATIANMVGPDNVVLICALATRPKEDNFKSDVLDYMLSWRSCWFCFFVWVFCGSKHHHLREGGWLGGWVGQ